MVAGWPLCFKKVGYYNWSSTASALTFLCGHDNLCKVFHASCWNLFLITSSRTSSIMVEKSKMTTDLLHWLEFVNVIFPPLIQIAYHFVVTDREMIRFCSLGSAILKKMAAIYNYKFWFLSSAITPEQLSRITLDLYVGTYLYLVAVWNVLVAVQWFLRQ